VHGFAPDAPAEGIISILLALVETRSGLLRAQSMGFEQPLFISKNADQLDDRLEVGWPLIGIIRIGLRLPGSPLVGLLSPVVVEERDCISHDRRIIGRTH